MEQGKISARQTFYILIVLVTATALMFLPAATSQAAGRDAWLAPVLATAPGIYLALVISALGKNFPGQTIMQYLQTALGTWPGKLAGLFYIFFFLHTNSLVIREFGELLAISVLPRTPLPVIQAGMLLLCAWTVRGGLEVLARAIELTIPQVMVVFFIGLALAVKESNFSNLTPFLANGFLPVIRASLAPEAWRGEIILLAMFLPYLAKPGEGRRSAVLAVLFIGVILTVTAIANTAVFGPLTAKLTIPTFSLFRSINLGFFERFDAFMVVIWVVGLYAKISIFYYVTVLGTAQLVNLRDYRPLVLPVGALLAALSFDVARNTTELIGHIVKVWPYFAFIFEYFVPTVLLVLAAMRKLK